MIRSLNYTPQNQAAQYRINSLSATKARIRTTNSMCLDCRESFKKLLITWQVKIHAKMWTFYYPTNQVQSSCSRNKLERIWYYGCELDQLQQLSCIQRHHYWLFSKRIHGSNLGRVNGWFYWGSSRFSFVFPQEFSVNTFKWAEFVSVPRSELAQAATVLEAPASNLSWDSYYPD
jgi:hypothetical protein